MGIYFTLIATAAIPSLRETKLPDGFSSEKFEEQLEGLKWKDEAVNKLFPGRGTPSATGTDDQPIQLIGRPQGRDTSLSRTVLRSYIQ